MTAEIKGWISANHYFKKKNTWFHSGHWILVNCPCLTFDLHQENEEFALLNGVTVHQQWTFMNNWVFDQFFLWAGNIDALKKHLITTLYRGANILNNCLKPKNTGLYFGSHHYGNSPKMRFMWVKSDQLPDSLGDGSKSFFSPPLNWKIGCKPAEGGELQSEVTGSGCTVSALTDVSFTATWGEMQLGLQPLFQIHPH